MRKANREITDKAILEEILTRSTICRVAMMDNGLPYILPFNYGYKDNCIYIHCAPEGKKTDLLRENSRVCFEVEQTAEIVKEDKACKWTTTYRSVVGYGNIAIITDFAGKQKGLEIIMAHNGAPELTDFEPKNVDAAVVLKLTIDTLTGKQSGNWNKIQESTLYDRETERLFLKEIKYNDLEDIHRLHSIPAVDEFNTLGIPETLEDTERLMNPLIEARFKSPRKSFTWKIELKSSGDFIGLAGMTLSNDKFRLGEIFYKLHPDFWGNGYATEIARRLIKLGFEELTLHKVEAGVATGNVKSIRVLEKTGMTREGLRRQILPIRGEWTDNYHYAIVETDKRDY